MRIYSFYLLAFIIGFGLSGCESAPNQAPDVSDIDVKLELIRYDKELSDVDPEQSMDSYLKLVAAYPNITDLYFKRLMNLHHAHKDTFYNRLTEFVSDERIKILSEKVETEFKDFSKEKKELTQAFKYFKYYFPDRTIPRIYTLYTEFAFQTFIFSDTENRDAIGISLDMFLGQDFNYKRSNPSNPAFSDYLTRSFNKDHITKKAVEMAVEDVMGPPPGKRFIDIMMHQGKKLYILEKLMPMVMDTVIHEYSASQMKWAKENELQMWDFILEQKLMYEANNLKISKYLQPSPTSKGMPSLSPGRTGSYMGYRVVSAFMNRNEMNLQSLIDFKDAQLLLEKSKFRPARK